MLNCAYCGKPLSSKGKGALYKEVGNENSDWAGWHAPYGDESVKDEDLCYWRDPARVLEGEILIEELDRRGERRIGPLPWTA